jgi:GT2 family glycosyltransferase
MCRRELFDQVGGFREDLIAGEDPEFCLRARLTGALIWHLHDPMAFHDGNMTRFMQWWRRAMRTGYAYAEGFKLHGRRPVNHYRRELGSVYIWAVIIPALVFIASIVVSGWCLLGLFVYPLQVARIALRGQRDARSNWLYAAFVVLGKLPESLGVLRFHRDRLRNRQKLLIEYK